MCCSAQIWRTVLPVLALSLAILAARSYPMMGARLVTMAMLYSTSSLQRSIFASMPSTQRSRKTLAAVGQQAGCFPECCAPARASSRSDRGSRCARPGDRCVVADHLRADLHQRLAHHGVHLAGHDRAARLRLGKPDLADPAARAAAQPADVVGDFEEADRDGFQLAARLRRGRPLRPALQSGCAPREN